MKTTPFLLAVAACSAIVDGHPAPAAGAIPPPVFRESFSHSLGDYWCEQGRVTVADVDGDGRKDIVLNATALANSNGPPWTYQCRAILLRALAEGGFAESVIADFPGDYGYNLAVGDLNNDGSPDLVLRAWTVTHVFLNDGKANFHKAGTAPSGYYIGHLVDANRDGFLDILSGHQSCSGGLIELSLNDGTGTNFTRTWESRPYGSGLDSVETVLSVNLNGDEFPDIAAREIYGGRIITLLGSSNATPYLEQREAWLGDRTFALAAGRVNGDSLDDLAAHVGWGEVRVFINQGDGKMSNSWTSPNLGQAAFNLALADFDLDGRGDVFVGTFGDGALRIYRSDGTNGFDEWWNGRVPGHGYTGSVADLNDDGAPDLIVGEKHHLRVLINQTGRPEIASVTPSSSGTSVTWRGIPGRRYQPQYKTRLDGATWIDLGDAQIAGVTSESVTDTNAISTSQRFYRIVQLE